MPQKPPQPCHRDPHAKSDSLPKPGYRAPQTCCLTCHHQRPQGRRSSPRLPSGPECKTCKPPDTFGCVTHPFIHFLSQPDPHVNQRAAVLVGDIQDLYASVHAFCMPSNSCAVWPASGALRSAFAPPLRRRLGHEGFLCTWSWRSGTPCRLCDALVLCPHQASHPPVSSSSKSSSCSKGSSSSVDGSSPVIVMCTDCRDHRLPPQPGLS